MVKRVYPLPHVNCVLAVRRTRRLRKELQPEKVVVIWAEVAPCSCLGAVNVRWMVVPFGIHAAKEVYKQYGSGDLVF